MIRITNSKPLSALSVAFFSLMLTFCKGPEISQMSVPRFETQVLDDDVAIGYGLAIGDVDGDQKKDILLADKKQFVWFRNPDWERFVIVDSLTMKDNVCLAARDINGDGMVEVAVGAQWNPGETTDSTLSGSVHYLIRPADPTQLWEPVKLPHEPTVHRMRWMKTGNGYQLIVLPLHGRGNKLGRGAGVKVLAYHMPSDPRKEWKLTLVDEQMHMTHNMDLLQDGNRETLLIGGKEGAKMLQLQNGSWKETDTQSWSMTDQGFGEIRKGDHFIAGIQPMHGNSLALYDAGGNKKILTDSLKQGHALACADLLGQGRDQIVVGWREPNDWGEMGIMLFAATDTSWTDFRSIWIDKNEMACEDLKVEDLNADGKPDIIAAGRSTKNLKIYWNQSQ